MKKIFLKVGFLLCFALAFINLGAINEAFATNWEPGDLDQIGDDVMPVEVKEVLTKSSQSEVEDASTTQNGDISTFATKIGVGYSDSASKNSSVYGSKAGNVIYTEVTNAGKWSGLAYYEFEGWGYTGYTGTGSISKLTSNVSVRASGIIPSISADGTSWNPLSSKKEIADDEFESGTKFAQANFSGVKIQNISTVTAIFENKSSLKISGMGSDTWYEDIWFWF